jgi:hypothetical protein
VSEGGLEPPCPLRALAPQASASTYSATRTWVRPVAPDSAETIASSPRLTGRDERCCQVQSRTAGNVHSS